MAKISIILPRIPFPLDKGDKLRAYNQILELVKYHDVDLHCLYYGKKDVLPADFRAKLKSYHSYKLNFLIIFIFTKIGFIFGSALQISFYKNHIVRKKLQKNLKNFHPQLVYYQLLRTAFYTKNLNYPIIGDFQDNMALAMKRRYQNSKKWYRFIFKRESNLMRNFQQKELERITAATLISNQDLIDVEDHLKHKVSIVKNGINTNLFVPIESIKKDYDFGFAGNLAYPPNKDACMYICQEIWPLIKKQLPDVNCIFIGASADKELKQAAKNAGIKVTGWVDTMPEFYNKCKVLITPMRMGAGLQNKILEALSCEVPVVSTEIAAKPISTKELNFLQVSSDKTNFATKSIALVNSSELKNIAVEGRNFVISSYSWSSKTEDLLKLIDKTISC